MSTLTSITDIDLFDKDLGGKTFSTKIITDQRKNLNMEKLYVFAQKMDQGWCTSKLSNINLKINLLPTL